MKRFIELKKNLKKDFSTLKPIRLAILGDTSTQFLSVALRGLGFDHGYDLKIWEADFNQIERQVFDPTSELYEFKPEVTIVFRSSHKLLGRYNKSKPDEQKNLASREIELIDSIYSNITENLKSKIIYFNYTEIDDSVFGNFANKTEYSFLYQLRKLNYELMVSASNKPNLFICDISSIQNQVGKITFFESSLYINTDMVLSIEVLPKIAAKTLDLINSLSGKFKKCVILDLDNTTWGGIIGDDGMENIQIGSLGIGKAFSEFQYWIKKLKYRGIIVAVCSKNTESIAKEPFEKHPDMVLRLEDISVFKANWDNKVDNIRQIQSILNIGFDSMVFLDDNPFERNIVKENIPEICVPKLPEDPANYMEYLYELNLFETVSFSGEDMARTKLYQIEAERAKSLQKFTNEEDFLKNLKMVSKVDQFNKFNTPRVSQLSQRSNQFNVRTIRYSEAEIEKIANSEEYASFTFTLEDKFGDNGLICAIILKKENKEILFFDTWIMSCRVLKRGMESFVMETITKYARENGFKTLKGEYIPTVKNVIVKDIFQELGFKKVGPYFLIDVSDFKNKKSNIKRK